ncbi:hypothetical protein [Streptosporangium amethystogenes]|uniref:hypothetical protein n=1 Tax=Streptosporangium amethystogenes TaxID=2002 RepID=UPI00068EE945|nr:hypothetical protein [Streptosporangium amethystogenes]
MTTVLLVLVCLLAVVLFIQIGAQVELFEQVRQIRGYLDMEDKPTPVELGTLEGASPSRFGLPAVLDHAEQAVVLFVSNKCETCRNLASALRGGAVPPSMWVVVVPVTGDGNEFIDEFELRGERVLLDEGELIVNSIGLDLTPVALHIAEGKLTRAHTVPTVRQMYAATPITYRYNLARKPSVQH